MHDCYRHRPFAVVTGASSGLGLDLAQRCAAHGFDLLVAAEDPALEDMGALLRRQGTAVQTVRADLAAPGGIGRVLAALGSRPVHALLAHAGHGLDQVLAGAGPAEPGPFVKAYLKGTVELIQRLGRRLLACEGGRVLLLGPMEGDRAGPLQALCTGTRVFIAGLSETLRQDFEGSGRTVTCCMPDGGTTLPDRTATLGRVAFDAMMQGDPEVVLTARHGHSEAPHRGAHDHPMAGGQDGAEAQRVAVFHRGPFSCSDGGPGDNATVAWGGAMGGMVRSDPCRCAYTQVISAPNKKIWAE